MDRNYIIKITVCRPASLSARRAWIEIERLFIPSHWIIVALRKESVDRNSCYLDNIEITQASLSARRAWIEITSDVSERESLAGRSPQGERG